MAVARMKKVTIVGHLSDREKAIFVLQKLGTVQILDIKESTGEVFTPAPSEASASSSVEDTLSKVTFCMSFMERFRDNQKGLLESFIGPKIMLGKDQYHNTISAFDLDAMYEKCVALDSRLSEHRNLRARISAQRDMLSPWSSLDLALEEIKDTAVTEVFAAIVPVAEVPGLEAAFNNTHAALLKVSQDTRQAFVIAVVLKNDKEAQDALRPFSINRVSFGELSGTARANLARLEADLSKLESDEKAVALEVRGLLEHYTALLTLYDEHTAARSRFSVTQNFARTQQVFAIQGWVKAKEAEHTRHELDAATDGTLAISFEDPGTDDSPPVHLDNHKLIEPFEMVTTIYGLPSYNETDPTPLLAPFFFVYFGLALSDAAYGIILALISIYAIRKLETPWAEKKLFRLMIWCGAATFIFGALLGSWFGNIYDIPYFAFLKGLRDSIFVLDPMAEPLKMLMVSLALGFVQIWYGIFVKMQGTIRQSGLVTGLLDQGSWLFLLGSLVVLILGNALESMSHLAPLGANLAKAGALLVIACQGRSAQGWLAKPFLGLYGLYGIIGYFSDMLSYARLLALGLATGVIATVVNQMALLVKPTPFVGPILMLGILFGGHTFNLGINILGSFIHSARLQFVEFFTKFFEGGGRQFRPFRRENKYTAVRG